MWGLTIKKLHVVSKENKNKVGEVAPHQLSLDLFLCTVTFC